jgi:hypothetical protein
MSKDEMGEACGLHGRKEKYKEGFVRVCKGKRPLGRPRRILENNITMNPKGIG